MPLTTATEPLPTLSTTATHTHIHASTTMRNWSREVIMGFEALYAGRGRRNPVWSGKEAHWSLRGWIVKSAEHCGADYKPLDRIITSPHCVLIYLRIQQMFCLHLSGNRGLYLTSIPMISVLLSKNGLPCQINGTMYIMIYHTAL